MKKKLAAGILIALSCAYLTFLQDVFVLNSKLECLFIFVHFAAIGSILVWIREQYAVKSSQHIRMTSYVLVAAALLAFQGVFLPTVQFIAQNVEIHVSAVGEDGESPSKEAWFTQFIADGQLISLKDLPPEHNKSWTFIPEYGSYAFYPSQEIGENSLTFHVSAQKVSMTFGQNSWSGMVAVTTSPGQTEYLNLNSESSGSFVHTIDTSATVLREYKLWQRVLLNAGAFVLLAFVLDTLLVVLMCGLRRMKRMLCRK